MTALLEIAGLNSWYGSSQALFNVDLTVDDGEVVALMGRNGMGKSTLIKSVCQLLGRWEGTMRFGGTDLSGLSSHQAARLGLGLVPEGRRCFSQSDRPRELHCIGTSGNLAIQHCLQPVSASA